MNIDVSDVNKLLNDLADVADIDEPVPDLGEPVLRKRYVYIFFCMSIHRDGFTFVDFCRRNIRNDDHFTLTIFHNSLVSRKNKKFREFPNNIYELRINYMSLLIIIIIMIPSKL